MEKKTHPIPPCEGGGSESQVLPHREDLGGSPLRAVLFDMDGVLYNSMPYHAKAWHRAMAQFGYAASAFIFGSASTKRSKYPFTASTLVCCNIISETHT